MDSFVLALVFAILQVSHQNPMGSWTLLPHILVVEVDGSVGQQTLSCLQPPPPPPPPQQQQLGRTVDQGGDIIWRKNGVEEAQRGNSYVVELEESTGGGNYTCHSQEGSLLNHTQEGSLLNHTQEGSLLNHTQEGSLLNHTQEGSLLNHTVVLIHRDAHTRKKILVNDSHTLDFIDCSAQNYNGEFHCSWTWHSSRVGKVAFVIARRGFDDSNSQCSVDTSGHKWTCSSGEGTFSCSVDDSGQGIWCLDQQHCPYAEESQRIHITVYVKTEHFVVERYSKGFYLSDIVKPDKVQISAVNSTVVEWTYPSSWSTPSSYFPLTFQIKQLKRRYKECDKPCNDTRTKKTLEVHSTDICQFKVKKRVKIVCVRAKDALCNSQWSEWTYLRLRRGKNNKYKA